VKVEPSVSILSPSDGSTFTRGDVIGVSFVCAEDPFGPGLTSCSAPAGVLDTNKTGTFPFTVSATSLDGQTVAQTIHYKVVAPSNRFAVSHARPHPNGRVTLQLMVPGGGTVDIRETAPGAPCPSRGPAASYSRTSASTHRAAEHSTSASRPAGAPTTWSTTTASPCAFD
jgi:hypothetical protein